MQQRRSSLRRTSAPEADTRFSGPFFYAPDLYLPSHPRGLVLKAWFSRTRLARPPRPFRADKNSYRAYRRLLLARTIHESLLMK